MGTGGYKPINGTCICLWIAFIWPLFSRYFGPSNNFSELPHLTLSVSHTPRHGQSSELSAIIRLVIVSFTNFGVFNRCVLHTCSCSYFGVYQNWHFHVRMLLVFILFSSKEILRSGCQSHFSGN